MDRYRLIIGNIVVSTWISAKFEGMTPVKDFITLSYKGNGLLNQLRKWYAIIKAQ
jgi:hypothetical protein